MKCPDVDLLLCDYLDGSLSLDKRRGVEDHLLECSSCSKDLAEMELATAFLREAPAVEPPPQLIADIIHDTIGIGGAPVPAVAGGAAPAGGFFSFLRPLFQPVLQPRFVMSMAMSVLSLSMLTFYGRRAVQNWDTPQAAPVAVVETLQSGVERVWDRVEEIYDSAAMFYELQTGFPVEYEAGIEASEEAAPAADLPAEEKR